MLVFRNKGEIEQRLITTIGVNVKDTPNPIGYFGTGLKYAIAVAMRAGWDFEIHSGLQRLQFLPRKEIIRGKEFTLIRMQGPRDGVDLHFTTEMGKNWKPWMVYRELWSNAKDEVPEGDLMVELLDDDEIVRPKAGTTQVIVKGLDKEHQNQWFLLGPSAPLQTLKSYGEPGLELHPGPSKYLFYRGIAVTELSKPSTFKYNILGSVTLTEDRTLSQHMAEFYLSLSLGRFCENESVLKKVIQPEERTFERGMDWDHLWDPSEKWMAIAQKAAQENPLSVNESVRKKALKEGDVKKCPTCGRPLSGEAALQVSP
jgi:hypothetical protein